MNTNEFDRLAPHFLDGSLSARQVAALTQEIQNSPEARIRLEAMERESGWIAKAFELPASEARPDLSRILLRVRRRNPYRKMIVHPAFALTAQLVFGVGLLVALFSLNADLLPPELAISSIDGELASPAANEEGAFELLVGVPITTPVGSQASISFAGLDNVLLNQDTRMSVKAPADGVREVIELEHGELWTQLRRRDEPLLIRFTRPELADWQVRANNAQVAVYAGSDIQDHEPRMGEASAGFGAGVGAVRLLSGEAWIENRKAGGVVHGLARGVAYMLGKEGPVPLADPDASVYSRLRLQNGQRFKLQWNWADSQTFPLSVDGATYPVWKVAMQAAAKIEAEREAHYRRDGQNELHDFESAINAALELVGEDTQKGEAIQRHTGELNAAQWRTLHLPSADGGNPALLAALKPYVDELRKVSASKNPENSDDLVVVFQNLRNDTQLVASRGEADSKRLARLFEDWQAAQTSSDDAFVKLDAHRKESNLDADGTMRAELRKAIADNETDALRLQALATELEGKNSLIRSILGEIDTLQVKLEPLLDSRKTADAEIANYQAVVDQTVFSEELLEQAGATLASAVANTQRLAGLVTKLSQDQERLRSQVATLQTTLEEANDAEREARINLDGAEAFVIDAAVALSNASAQVDSLSHRVANLEVSIALAKEGELASLLTAHQLASAQLTLASGTQEAARKDLNEGLRESAQLAEIRQAALAQVSARKAAHQAAAATLRATDDDLGKKIAEQDAAQGAEHAAKTALENLVEAGRTKARAVRLLNASKEILVGLNQEIEPLEADLAARNAAKAPLQKEADALRDAIMPLPNHLATIAQAESTIRAIERAIDAEQRLHVLAIHEAQLELLTLRRCLDEAAAVRTVFTSAPLRSFRGFDEELAAIADGNKTIDELDGKIAALRSDETEARAKLNEELRALLPKAQRAYEELALRMAETLAALRGGDSSGVVSLSTLALDAKARVLAATWLENFAKDVRTAAHELMDGKIIDYNAWLKNELGFTVENDQSVYAKIRPFATTPQNHAALETILIKDNALRDSKPAAKQSRLDHEQEKVEKRAALLKQVRLLRAKAPSGFEAEILAITVDAAKLGATQQALFADMWTLFHNGQAILPSSLRELDETTRIARREGLLRDYYHAYLAGDRSGEAFGVHNTWRARIKAAIPRESYQQLMWLLEEK